VALLSARPEARPAAATDPIQTGEIDSRAGLLAAQDLAIPEGIPIALGTVNVAGGVRGCPPRVGALAQAVDQVVVLDQGVVGAPRRPEEVLAAPGGVAAGVGRERQGDPRGRRAFYEVGWEARA
jgi:hypothetical protein